jgi:hypothetical protein
LWPKISPRTSEQVRVDPNFLKLDTRLWYPTRELYDLMMIAVVSWWLPEEIGFLIREDLDRIKSRFCLADQIIIKICLTSKEETILFLVETSLFHSRDFFGNLLPKLRKNLSRTKFKYKSTKVRKPQRKRGYADHGSKCPDEKWQPKADYSLDRLQEKIERERRTSEDSFKIIRGGIY